MFKKFFTACSTAAIFISLSACQPAAKAPDAGAKIQGVATESFLADIAQNVAGDRASFSSLIPVGVDPHTFEPTPADVVKISNSAVLVENGAGVEEWLEPVLQNAQGQRIIVTASEGLKGRQPAASEEGLDSVENGIDPHFWLDPNLVIIYVENIRDGLIQADPQGTAEYKANADAYIQQLKSLDEWIKTQVAEIPSDQRMLITNHETLGYFADRYGFRVVGSIVPSTSSLASASAKDIANLENQIKDTGAKAIFLEAGSNPDLAKQISHDTGIRVVMDLYTHSLSTPDGPAPTYLQMMKYNVHLIIDALRNS